MCQMLALLAHRKMERGRVVVRQTGVKIGSRFKVFGNRPVDDVEFLYVIEGPTNARIVQHCEGIFQISIPLTS